VRFAGAADPYLAEFHQLFVGNGPDRVEGTNVGDDRTRAEFEWYAAWPKQDTGTAFYRVRSVDRDGNKSHTFSAPVSVVFKRRPFQNLALDLFEAGGIYHAPLCRDTLVFVASVSNPVFDKAAIHFDIVGWFGGAEELVYVYDQNIWKGMVRADTLAWYLGKPFEEPALPVPQDVDSTWWVNEGRFIPVLDLGKPDSLKVLVDSYLYDTDGLQTTTKRMLDVVVDGRGCYSLSESRLPRHLAEPYPNPFPLIPLGPL
jgi:hypothetical protein